MLLQVSHFPRGLGFSPSDVGDSAPYKTTQALATAQSLSKNPPNLSGLQEIKGPMPESPHEKDCNTYGVDLIRGLPSMLLLDI